MGWLVIHSCLNRTAKPKSSSALIAYLYIIRWHCNRTGSILAVAFNLCFVFLCAADYWACCDYG